MNRLRGTLYDGTTRLQRDDGTPLAMYSMAGLAEYAVVPATAIYRAARRAAARGVGDHRLRRLHRLRRGPHAGQTRAGDHVVVVATGGVGSIVVQVARAFGASR